jgi:hypothetical protein
MRWPPSIGTHSFRSAHILGLSFNAPPLLIPVQVVPNRQAEYFGDFDPFGDFDLLFGASKLNLHILEIPIRYQEGTYGITNIQRLAHGWLLLKMMMVYGFFRLKAV